MCARSRFGRADRRLHMSLSRLWLCHGLRGGCAAPEPEAVTGATPRRGRLACHGGGLGCACHPNPPREVAPGQRSLAGRPSDARDERVPSLRGEAERPDGQAVGPNVRRLLEAALGTGAPLAVLQPPARQRHRRPGPCPAERPFPVRRPPQRTGHAGPATTTRIRQSLQAGVGKDSTPAEGTDGVRAGAGGTGAEAVATPPTMLAGHSADSAAKPTGIDRR